MVLTPRTANLAWLAAALPAWYRFRWALRHPRSAQLRRLGALLRQNTATAFGREHRFASMLDRVRDRSGADLIERYRAAVPVRGYEGFEPYIRRAHAGEPGVLTSEPVERLVPTGGSSSGPKLIPFTRTMRREIRAAVNPWIVEIFLRHPGAVGGPAYWQITPALPPDSTGAVPVGFDTDSEHVGGAAARLARAVLAAPDDLARVADPAAFRYLTLLFLLRRRGLRILSVWHPSLLGGLLDEVPAVLPDLARDIERGTLSPPGHVANDVRQRLASVLRPDPCRADELRERAAAGLGALWPELAVLSCWADGGAAGAARVLHARLPGAALQAKGLLATEGVVSLPFAGTHPLAVASHVLEFMDERGAPHLADELQAGKEYTVVLTNGGGLYRYALGDRVVVTGLVEGTPTIRFAGRDDRCSDLCGEKVTDAFAGRAIDSLFGPVRPAFAMLAPDPCDGRTGYTLFVDDAADPAALGCQLEHYLRRSPQYAWAVDMRQLRPARVVVVGRDAERRYVEACVARGQRLGDIKVPFLHPDGGWAARFGVPRDALVRA